MKEKVGETNEMEYEELVEESSRSVEQHIGKIDWTAYNVMECLVSRELLTWMNVWWKVASLL